MREFLYTAQAARIVFGSGSMQHLAREIELLGTRRALVLSTPEQAADIYQLASAGEHMTKPGIWKLIRAYCEVAGHSE